MLDFPLLYLRFYMFYGRNGLLLLNAMLRIKISVIELKYVNEQLLFILPFQSDECFINLLQTSEKANPSSCFKWNIYDFRLFIWNLVQNIHVYAVSILNIKNRCSAKWSPRLQINSIVKLVKQFQELYFLCLHLLLTRLNFSVNLDKIIEIEKNLELPTFKMLTRNLFIKQRIARPVYCL